MPLISSQLEEMRGIDSRLASERNSLRTVCSSDSTCSARIQESSLLQCIPSFSPLLFSHQSQKSGATLPNHSPDLHDRSVPSISRPFTRNLARKISAATVVIPQSPPGTPQEAAARNTWLNIPREDAERTDICSNPRSSGPSGILQCSSRVTKISSKKRLLDMEILRLQNADQAMSEKQIRDSLGNNPDTSKALRRLTHEGKMLRTGRGGRSSPFLYRVTWEAKQGLQVVHDGVERR